MTAVSEQTQDIFTSETLSSDEWAQGELESYKEACFETVRALAEGKITFEDLKLFSDEEQERGLFIRYYDDEEASEMEEAYKIATQKMDGVRQEVPELVQNYICEHWLHSFLHEYDLDIRRDVLRAWGIEIQNNNPEMNISQEQLLGVLGTIQYLQEQYPQGNLRENRPTYLIAGSLANWVMKAAGTENLYIVENDVERPYQMTEEAREALNSWERRIGDVDVTVGDIPINKKGLFRLEDVNYGQNIFRDPDEYVKAPVRNIELRPSRLDMSEYMVANLGGIRIEIPTPEYALAFKKLQIAQVGEKSNSEMDFALLEALATDKEKVDKYYQENKSLAGVE